LASGYYFDPNILEMCPIFDSIVIKLGQEACLGNCYHEFDTSGERSRAILALLFGLHIRANLAFFLEQTFHILILQLNGVDGNIFNIVLGFL
jgi:hypothetical protein